MDDRIQFERRLAAVERAVIDGDRTFEDIGSVSSLSADVDRLSERCESLEALSATIEGDVTALQACLDTIAAEDETVADRADLAMVRVDQLERRLAAIEATPSVDPPPQTTTGTDTLASQLFERTDDTTLAPPPSDSPFLDETGRLTIESPEVRKDPRWQQTHS